MIAAWVAALVTLLLPSNAFAQHTDLARLWQSLTVAADIQALEKLAAPETVPDQPSAASRVTRGLIALRRFQLSGAQRDAEAARLALEEATRRDPQFAWAYFALGLSYLQAPLVRSPGMSAVGGGIGLDASALARNAFARALELEPAFVEPARALAELAMKTREAEDLKRGRKALESVSAAGRGDPELWFLRAELETAVGHAGAALAAADSALRSGGDAALALRARAAARFTQTGTDSAGAEAYFAGLQHLTPAAAERYFDDLAFIAGPEEKEAWASADLAGRAAWIRRFWEERAARDGITTTQRVASHYRRLARALREYHWRWLRDAPPPGALGTDRSLAGCAWSRLGTRVGHSRRRPCRTWRYGRDCASACSPPSPEIRTCPVSSASCPSTTTS
ncbi:MAG: hypothetical protein HY703_11490 [Gemmatimonadetes bacterium]|nr:hypothetical protein [Gemmatimonadota bacterium]